MPKGGGVYRVGKPYMVAGREYVPQEDVNYSAVGMASWYGDDFHGRYTANGEIFDMNSISAAHPTLPLPSYVRVTNLANHRSIVVRVNDRGPYVGNRVIDLSVQDRQAPGLLRPRPRQGEGRLCRPRAAGRLRRPQAGGDAARRRAGSAAPVLVASNKPYAPTYFDNRPMTQLPARVPAPPDRPYRLGEGAREVPAALAPQRAPDHGTGRRHPPAAATVARAPLPAAEPEVSPVSAYAPTRYDGRAGFMSGRGLY